MAARVPEEEEEEREGQEEVKTTCHRCSPEDVGPRGYDT